MIRKICLSIILLAASLLVMHQSSVMAACDASCQQIKGGISTANGGSAPTKDPDDTIRPIINLLTAAVGVVAVVMIIVAGYRYIASAGNAEKTKAAKNTLLYAVVGLVVVALAQTIAHFVLTEAGTPSVITPGKIDKTTPPPTPPDATPNPTPGGHQPLN